MVTASNSLIFFDKSGSALNFTYNDSASRYEGTLYMAPGSSDTFQIQSLYLFEQIPAFDYSQGTDLTLDKFQLFSENGLFFTPANYTGVTYSKITTTNIDSAFYSKYIYGENIEVKFPKGSEIIFDEPIAEFISTNRSYTVVDSIKGAILIISGLDNATFTTTYGSSITNTFSTISGINTIQVLDYQDNNPSIHYFDTVFETGAVLGLTFSSPQNYIAGMVIEISKDDITINPQYNGTASITSIPNPYEIITDKAFGASSAYEGGTIRIISSPSPLPYSNQLSTYNQQDFNTKLFNNKKLTVVNSISNDGVYTIENASVFDKSYYTYGVNSITPHNDLWIELILKTDLPLIYTGSLIFNASNNRVYFTGGSIPTVLTPGIDFQVRNSTLNNIFLTVSTINLFNPLTTYIVDNQVLFNNSIFQCIQNYTASNVNNTDPTDNNFWTLPTFLPIDETIINETLATSETYLTTNHLYFTYPGNTFSDVALASAASKYSSQFSLYDINLSFDPVKKLQANLNYAGEYADINFYQNVIAATNSIGWTSIQTAQVIQTLEPIIKQELNENLSQQYQWQIFITALDEFGMFITINKIDYYVPTDFVFVGPSIDNLQTVQNTLIEWYTKYFITLQKLGVDIFLSYFNQTIYYDTIVIQSHYPNVAIDFTVKMGSVAQYTIPHSLVTFYDIGNILTITINNLSYTQNFVIDAPTTLTLWVSANFSTLNLYGIYVLASGNTLLFSVKQIQQPLNYTITLGKSFLPAQDSYKIVNYILGNFGVVISGNQILNTNPLVNLETISDFSTGQIVNIKNSEYVSNNQEYNIILLQPDKLELSYQGPFYSTSQSTSLTAFSNAFNDGFGYDPNAVNILTGTVSPAFDMFAFISTINPTPTGYYDTNGNFIITTTSFNTPVIAITTSQYGSLDPNFVTSSNIELSVREYIRKPRENFSNEQQVSYLWSWVDDTTSSELFLIDFSGTQLSTGTSYSYTGPTPLTNVVLNNTPNTNLDWISLPEKQQTIFATISYPLDYIDSSTDISFVPEPLETFIGFNSPNEGVINNTLVLQKIESITFSIATSYTNQDILTFQDVTDSTGNHGVISIDINSIDNFFNKGLKIGQQIQLFIKDNTNTTNQFVSLNNGKIFKIRSIYMNYLIVDYLTDIFVNETTAILNYPTYGGTTYMTTIFNVIPKEIARIQIYGQTEIEDIRFKINLNNIGRNIQPNDVFIFKDYDIKEQGIDWKFLNQKRKEMLLLHTEIYNYIGSYKAIINAIRFFNYNDLELYEYYKNVNRASENYGKLFKVEIPDIFNPATIGFTKSDFILGTLPNSNFEATNLFNLTYRITNFFGDSVLTYSLDEVLIKLSGLKSWLKNNIIPLSHRITDITGRADFVASTTIQHTNFKNETFNINSTMTPVNFEVTETYLMPIINGSSVYNVVVSPSTISGVTASIPNYYVIDIKTYKTYQEWSPFGIYTQNDTVSYLGLVFKSLLSNNQLNNPNQYTTAPLWTTNGNYTYGQIVLYNGLAYRYLLITTPSPSPNSSVIPYGNPLVWDMISVWQQIIVPMVQNIKEYRTIDNAGNLNLLPFNFTVDINVDPFCVIKVTSDNGYGQNYTVKREIIVAP